jgi:hypothetical protein
MEHNVPSGTIPLSSQELYETKIKLEFWSELLSLDDREFPLYINVLRNDDKFDKQLVMVKQTDRIDSFQVERGDIIRLSIKNTSSETIFVYMIEVGNEGGINPIRLHEDLESLLGGMLPGDTKGTLPLKIIGEGFGELRFFCSPVKIDYLISPPSSYSRSR